MLKIMKSSIKVLCCIVILGGNLLISTKCSEINLIESSIESKICEDWIASSTGRDGNCTINNFCLNCYGGIFSLHKIPISDLKRIQEVNFCGWFNKTLYPKILFHNFPRLRNFRIAYSNNFTNIFNDFPRFHHLEKIEIIGTKLKTVPFTVFRKLYNLKSLDLRWNQLEYLEEPFVLSDKFQYLYLFGNRWDCTKNLNWLVNSSKRFDVIDRELLQCSDIKYQSKHLLTVIYYQHILQSLCTNNTELKNCSCSMHYIRKSNDGGANSLTPIYTVNCSNLNLYEFPSYIPDNTTIFHATNNHITDVQSLRNNIHYRSVLDVYLDYNNIQNIDVLEAGYWLRHFRVLSLRGNQLNKLPIYALDNALEKNHHAAKLYLSQNPWICDCKFTMRFQEILMKYISIIKDSSNVTCKFINNNKNNYMLATVLRISRNDLCKISDDYYKIRPLDLLNCVLAFLIIFVIGKLAYDYYHYRKSGRLPWIVTKIP